MAGHSFGGVTSFIGAVKNPKVKGIIALDPWFFPMEDKFLDS
jgi:pimeloyl-ACP methyl ester carboxylesterase